ncbi:probable G-protein coupled receptor 139 [Haliotis cracherodii]|uniref:probable G-protein coupled receptor 139 n=1 Tax=Haliotis cracherodii TaxID=6455 RepID=UPI0039ECFADC
MERNSSLELGITSWSPSQENNWVNIDALAYDIETYYLWAILALGFPGNCFTIITIIKMSPPRSLTVYIALLAIVDNLAIVNKLLMFVLTDNGVQIGTFGCKFLGFFGNFLITYGNWLLVGLSVERFAAVWFPFQIGKIWTFRKSLTVVMSITLPLVGLFLHLFWTMDYRYYGSTKSVFCKINEKYIYFMVHVWYWINVLVYAVVPCVLLLVFNLLIIVGIVNSTKTHRYLNRSGLSSDANAPADRQRQITIMLVTSAITLVVLTTPRCVLLIMSPYLNPPNKSMEGAVLYLIDTIAYILCDSTHAINFYLYSLSARRFRCQFLEFCCKRKSANVTSQYISMCSRPSVHNSTQWPHSADTELQLKSEE